MLLISNLFVAVQHNIRLVSSSSQTVSKGQSEKASQCNRICYHDSDDDEEEHDTHPTINDSPV